MSTMFPPLQKPNKPLNQAVLPMNTQTSTPVMLPQKPKKAPFGAIVYNSKTDKPKEIKHQFEPQDVPAIRETIAHNETRGEKNPYAFSRNSGSKNLGKALGRYQITEGELQTYSDRFLGKKIDAKTFLANPHLQDEYMENKIEYLLGKNLPVEKVLVAHRGGFSDFDTLDAKLGQYKGYVDEGLMKYNEIINQQNAGQK